MGISAKHPPAGQRSPASLLGSQNGTIAKQLYCTQDEPSFGFGFGDAPVPKEAIRLFLVDNEPIFLTGLQAIISQVHPSIEVQGFGAITDVLPVECSPLEVDIILVCINESLSTLIEPLQTLKERCPNIKIIIASASPNPIQLATASKFGVHGYIEKTAPALAFLEILLCIANTKWSESYNQNLATGYEKPFIYLRSYQHTQGLSRFELDILQALANGSRTEDIAGTNMWSYAQTKYLIRRTLKKMQVSSRTLAVAKAIQQGII